MRKRTKTNDKNINIKKIKKIKHATPLTFLLILISIIALSFFSACGNRQQEKSEREEEIPFSEGNDAPEERDSPEESDSPDERDSPEEPGVFDEEESEPQQKPLPSFEQLITRDIFDLSDERKTETAAEKRELINTANLSP